MSLRMRLKITRSSFFVQIWIIRGVIFANNSRGNQRPWSTGSLKSQGQRTPNEVNVWSIRGHPFDPTLATSGSMQIVGESSRINCEDCANLGFSHKYVHERFNSKNSYRFLLSFIFPLISLACLRFSTILVNTHATVRITQSRTVTSDNDNILSHAADCH